MCESRCPRPTAGAMRDGATGLPERGWRVGDREAGLINASDLASTSARWGVAKR